MLSFLARRDYRSVALYEVDAEKPVPFFEVAYGSDRYDSRTMGSGELAVFSLWWALERSARGTIILIEEPETFLSPAIQEAFGHYLTSAVVEKELCAVVTSHSAEIIGQLGKENLRFLSRERTGVRVMTDQPPPILLQSVGIRSPVEALVFVEDNAARNFCRAILERFDPNLARKISIDVRKGDGEIIRALQVMADVRCPITFVGLIDGDMRHAVPADIAYLSAFLPGEQSVELLFREALEADSSFLAEASGVANIDSILAALEGSNHHDWFENLSKELGLTKDQLFPLLFRTWIRMDGSEESLNATCSRVAEILGGQELTQRGQFVLTSAAG
jgi:hypothetical protein